MTQPVLLKLYANIWPVNDDMFHKIEKVASSALPTRPEIEYEGDLLRISFEGIYFPIEELIQILECGDLPALQGKVDYLDIENWTLSRYVICDSKVTHSGAPLNNVMDYSGH